MKIVYIGAGSKDFGRGQIVDIMQVPQFKGRGDIVSLVDTNEENLRIMTLFAEKVKAHFGADIVIESATDRKKALVGADYVITSVARKRYELWEQDFRVPLSYGFKHCLGENGGPGAMFHALRSLDLIIPICRDIEAICPKAFLLNFTNPEARVLHAICTLTKVKAVGICHGVFSALNKITEYLKKPVEDLEIVSAGMNHFFQILKVRDKKSGQDLLPQLLQAARDDLGNTQNPLFKKMVEIFDLFTYPSDDHIGEYLAYGADFSGTQWHYGRECRAVQWNQPEGPIVPWHVDLDDYATGKKPLDNKILCHSGETTVAIICDIETNRPSWRPAVNVLNTERYIENLPENGVVEVPAMVDGNGMHPQKVGKIGEPVAAMIRTHYAIHNLLSEAYNTRKKRLLLQALLLDPAVNSIVGAEKMLDQMLQLQKDFLPEFS